MPRYLSWLVLVAVLAFGLYYAKLARRGNVDSNREGAESLALSEATSLEVRYTVQGQGKRFTVGEPPALPGLLNALKIVGERPGVQLMSDSPVMVEFQFASGAASKRAMLLSRTELEVGGWGVLTLTPAFFEALTAEISRREGRPIRILEEK